MKISVDATKLIEAGAHYGHQAKRWNPKMKEYLYGEENGVHIFDLIKTKKLLEEVLEVLNQAGKNGERVIFVGTKKQAEEKVQEVAQKTEQFYVNERWLGGTLTNFDQMKKTLRSLVDMKEKRQKGEYDSYTKKEKLLLNRKIERMERFFGGLKGIEEIPAYVVVVDTKKEAGAVFEARKVGAKSIAIVDSNCDPVAVDFAIPMNDDASKAIAYVLDLMAEAYNSGKNSKVGKKEKKGKEKNE